MTLSYVEHSYNVNNLTLYQAYRCSVMELINYS